MDLLCHDLALTLPRAATHHQLPLVPVRDAHVNVPLLQQDLGVICGRVFGHQTRRQTVVSRIVEEVSFAYTPHDYIRGSR